MTVEEVGPPDGVHGPNITNIDGFEMFDQHPSMFPLNYAIGISDPAQNAPIWRAVFASVLEQWWNRSTNQLEPSSTIGTRSTCTISVDEAVYNQPGVAFKVCLKAPQAQGGVIFSTDIIAPADVPDAETFINVVSSEIDQKAIIDFNPSSGGGGLIVSNEQASGNYTTTLPGDMKAVFRSMAYGNIPRNHDWELEFQDQNGTPLEFNGILISAFTPVEDRRREALASQWWRQTLKQRSDALNGGMSFDYVPSMDLAMPSVVRLHSTLPGSDGNGHSIFREPDSFHTYSKPSKWNGVLSGNMNGGFSGGFGPMVQKAGMLPDSLLTGNNGEALLWDQLDSEEYDHDLLSLTLNEELRIFTGKTSHGNLVGQRHATDAANTFRLFIEFVVDGVQCRFVLEASPDGVLSHVPGLGSHQGSGLNDDTFSGTVDYASGAVTVSYEEGSGIEALELKFLAGYSYYLNPYRLAWTIYRGSSEMIDSQGFTSKSFDNLTFAPAMKFHTVGSTHQAGPAGHNGVVHTADGDYMAPTSMVGYGPDNQTRALWIRLGKPFQNDHPSIGGSPSKVVRGGEFTITDFPTRGHDPSDIEYLEELYDGQNNVNIKTSLPIDEGSELAGCVYGEDGAIQRIFRQLPLNNIKGQSGFLIPVPLGTATYDSNKYASPNPITDNDLLEHQVVQLFEGANEDFGDTKILISGVPGGVPLPGLIDASIRIDSDSVHIGGMTDVYIKAGQPEEVVSEVITLSPSSHESIGGSDVVIQASDGIVNPNIDPTHFFSAELEAELVNRLGNTPAYAENMILEIIDPPSNELTPTVVRIAHSIPGGCKIVGSFPAGLAEGFENLRFRVLASSTTNLENPLELLQEGQDLATSENSFTVDFAGGLDFAADPEITEVYLSIDSGEDSGEYLVSSKNLSRLTLERVTNLSATGLSYRIYKKQTGSVLLPLVRIKDVSLSGDSQGIKVPYAKPIDIVGSAFSGLNDDPINEDTVGEAGGTLSKQAVTLQLKDDLIEDRCVFSLPGHDFKSLGVIRYDVINFEELDDNLKHFYVDEIHADQNGDFSILVLDRAEAVNGDLESTPFVIGKPSIGNASVKFLDRTFFEVGPDSVFCYENPTTGKKSYLRPSPAEAAEIYKSELTRTDIRLYGSAPAVLETSDDMFLHGISAGDKLRIVSKVIKTSEFNGDQLEHENINVSGQTLAFKIENSIRTVTFSGPNPLTIDDVVNDINRQLGSLLRAEVNVDTRDDNNDGVEETYYRIMIYSRNDVEVVTQGSIGVVGTLKFNPNDMDNTPDASGIIDEYTVEGVSYTEGANTSDGEPRTKITLTNPVVGAPPANEHETLFIEVLREGRQRVMPSQMATDSSSLLSADLKLTSFEPNTSEGIVPDNAQLTVEGYDSLGYSLIVDNKNYSYSMGESLSIQVSSVVLEEAATSFEEAYELAGVGATITYDRAPEVSAIQDYMLDASVRVLCNNPLVKHYFPAYPLMTITCTGGSSKEDLEDRLASHLATLYPNLPLEVYSISSMLASEGVTYQKNPQEVGFIVHDSERNVYVSRSTDIATLNKQTHIMEDLSLVNINKVG